MPKAFALFTVPSYLCTMYSSTAAARAQLLESDELVDEMRDELAKLMNFLCGENLTPLLRQEAGQIRTLRKSRPGAHEEFDALYAQIERHSHEIHGTAAARSSVVWDAVRHQRLLTAVLLEDYADEHPRFKNCRNIWVSEWAKVITRHRNQTNDPVQQRAHSLSVVAPIKNSMLNRGHVEKRLLSAAAQHQGLAASPSALSMRAIGRAYPGHLKMTASLPPASTEDGNPSQTVCATANCFRTSQDSARHRPD